MSDISRYPWCPCTKFWFVLVAPLHCNGGLPRLDIWLYPAERGDMRGSPLGPLLPPFRSGAGLSPGCSHFLPASICTVSPNSTSTCAGNASAAVSGGGGLSYWTPSAGQRHTGCAGSGIFRCRRWGPLSLWDLGPGRVSGTPPSTVSAPRWRAGCMHQWYGLVTINTNQKS